MFDVLLFWDLMVFLRLPH